MNLPRREFLPWILSPLAALWPWKAKAAWGQPGDSALVGHCTRWPDEFSIIDGVPTRLFCYGIDGRSIKFVGEGPHRFTREQAEWMLREATYEESLSYAWWQHELQAA